MDVPQGSYLNDAVEWHKAFAWARTGQSCLRTSSFLWDRSLCAVRQLEGMISKVPSVPSEAWSVPQGTYGHNHVEVMR